MKSSVISQFLWLALALCFSMVLVATSACSMGKTIEYDSEDSELVGKVIRFKKPMSYLLLSAKDKDDFSEVSIEIGRFIVTRRDAEGKFSYLRKYPNERVPLYMKFTIIKTYWVRQSFLGREFAPDLHTVVLRSMDNIYSTYNVNGLELGAEFL